jgi:ABC-2 type transport system permease protein
MVDYLCTILVMCRKELLAVLKEPRNRNILLVPVLLQGLLFGYAATFDLNRASYAVLDQSHCEAATDLVARLDGTGLFKRVATLHRQGDIARVIEEQKALLVLQFGPQFGRQLAAGNTAPVQLILDARNSITAGTASSYVSSLIDAFNADWRSRHGGNHPAFSVASRAWYNPNLETRWDLLPGIIASLSVVQTLVLAAQSVAREREQGTFDQMLVTPMTPMQIMIGKAIPPILIGLTQSTILFLITRLWFHIPFAGSLLTLYLGLIMFTITSVGIGLSISAFSTSMQQSLLYSFMTVNLLSMLSGLLTPIKSMPPLLRTVTLFNPLRYAIDLVRRVYLEGAPLSGVVSDIWPLAIMALITLPTAAWLFRHRLV